MSLTGLIRSIVIFISSILCKLPENFGRMLFVSIGMIVSKLWISERNRLEDVINRVYFRANKVPPQSIKLIIDKMFIHFSLNMYELMVLPSINKKWISQRVELLDTHHLDKALAKGNGVILALPHIGNWELLGAALTHKGYPIHSFFLAQKENELGSLLDYFRSFSKIVLHDRDRDAIKAYKSLKQGEILAMIADQDGANKGVYTDFLSHWVSMPAGPANWALRTKATIIPLYSLRSGTSNKLIAKFMPPILPIKTNNHNNDVIHATSLVAEWMETLILKHPHQYLWFYDRFKPRHEGYIAQNKQNSAKMCHGKPWYGE